MKLINLGLGEASSRIDLMAPAAAILQYGSGMLL